MTYSYCNFDMTIHNQKLTVCVTHLSRNLPREISLRQVTGIFNSTYESIKLHLNSSILGLAGEKYFLECFEMEKIPYQKYNFPVMTGLFRTFSRSLTNV